MLTKSDPDEIQSFLSDASYMRDGYADRVVFPETEEEMAQLLAAATADRTPVTVSGAGTGTVGGRVAFGGIVLATDKLNHVRKIVHESNGFGHAIAEAGVVLSDLQKAVESEGLLYPPDPTERSCFLGGTIATNASGSRTFKYGPTRKYVNGIKLVLATGERLGLRRGDLHADSKGRIRIPLSGRVLEAQLPDYRMPQTRKNAAGYFIAPEMDVLDLFVGSEGTLGVVVEAELRLLPKPADLVSGVVFFKKEDDVLSFVSEARSQSLSNRLAVEIDSATATVARYFDARALEYFDVESLNFLRQKYPTVPTEAVGAIFFEQEMSEGTEETILTQWTELVDRHHALTESWFATNDQDQSKLREFRHQLPVLMNEWFARYHQRKVSTDMAVPDEAFAGIFQFYQNTMRSSGLRYTIFGHIGDNHLHVNILPRDEAEGIKAREIYVKFLHQAAAAGGTLSAEHGVGKLKRDYLRLFYTDEDLRAMARLKRMFDPAGILGRGNIFKEELLWG